MVTVRDEIASLLQGLREDQQGYQQLLELLREQHLLLCRLDSQGLLGLNRRHADAVEPLRARAKERGQCLLRLGCSADPAGMEQLLTRLPRTLADYLRDLWAQLQQGVQACKQQNDINGRLLAGQQELLRQLLPLPDVGYPFSDL